jgi:biotin carboxyl carrier protein
VVGTTTWLTIGGQTFKVAEGESGANAAGGTDSDLEAPMPGTVLAVECAVGDTVAEGQTLLVVEAMKMEHAIKAPRPGVVSKIAATVGALVSPGAPLVVLDPIPGEDESA